MSNPRLTLLHTLPFLALCGSPLMAGSYVQNYDSFANGVTNLGDGSTISSNPLNTAACSVQGQKMRMSSGAVGGTFSLYRLPDLDPGSEVNSFDVQFDFHLTAGTGMADGMSLNFGGVPLTDTTGPGEEGYSMTGGLVVSFDTYVNAGEAGRSIDVKVDGIQVATLAETAFGGFNVAGAQRRVTVRWDSNGLDVIWRNVATGTDYTVCNNLAVPRFIPQSGDRFVFSARTGGETETLDLDNLAITSTTPSPIITPDLAFSELVIDNTQHEDEHCNTPGWLEIYNGTGTSKDLSTYTLTDDSAVPAKWAFPAGTTLGPYSYRVVYFGYDGLHPKPDTRLHTSFVPVKTGGFLGLYNGGTLVDSWNPYPSQTEDVAYGYLGLTRTLGFLETASPGVRNSGTQAAGGPSNGEVAFNRAGGLVTAAFPLTLSIAPLPAVQPVPGAVIRYTTDNSLPTPASPQYTAPINITNSTIIRARIFEPGRLPGDIASRGYILLNPNLTNYRGAGAFNSNLPVIVFDSFGNNIDGAGGASGLRQFQSAFSVVVAPDPARGNRSILDAAALIDFQGRCGTHLRGETSAGFPQRPYAWELWDNNDGDKDASILGMPADSDWILISNYNDKSLLRNILPFQTLRDAAGPGAALGTQYVEVFFNQTAGSDFSWEDYRGVYVLTEKIKRAKDRVDISKLDPCEGTFTNNPAVDDVSAISGGYIIRRDKLSPEVSFGTTNYPLNIPAGQLGLQIVEPGAPSGDQVSYIQNYMNRFEASLNTPADPVNNFYRYADVDSFIFNAWWVEIFKQIDGYRLSTYYYKDRGGKLRAHPLWDYNLSTGNANYATGMDPTKWYFDNGGGGIEYTYYQKMFAHAATNLRRWDLYWQHRRGMFENNTILSRIDSMITRLRDGLPGTNDISNGTGVFPSSTPSVECPAGRHNARWQRLGVYDWPNADGFGTRTRWENTMTAAQALALSGNDATEYGLEFVNSDTGHARAWLIKRLDWIDNGNFSGSTNTILRPVLYSLPGGNVSAGQSLAISAFTGTAPAAALYPPRSGTLSYAAGTIYYTLDGSDPIQASAPGDIRNFVLDNNVCEASVPTSAAADTDAFGKNWRAWDFTTTAYNASTNPAGWISGLNGVGFDNNTTTTPDYGPHINIRWNTTAVPVAGRPTMLGVTQSSYIRLPFTLTAGDLSGVSKLRLYGKVDDGFVAYINGVRLVASNPPATTLAWNSGASGTQPGGDNDAIIYREFTATGADNAACIAALRTGTNVLAIHGLNAGVSSSDFLQRFKLDAETVANTPSVFTYTSAITINSSVTVKARLQDSATGGWTPLAEATFVVDTAPASASNLVVSEIMYNPSAPTGPEVTAGFNDDKMFEYIEVMNIGAGPVDLNGVSFSNGFAFAWPSTNPALRVLNPGERAVVAGNLAAFNFRYAPAPGIKVAGVMAGNLSNGGERITLTGTGGVIKDFTYSDSAPWPTEPDGSGASLVLNNPAANPDHNQAINWRASAAAHGTPGGASHTPFAGSPLADSDGDGIADILEYATGTAGSAGGGASHPWPASGRTTWTPPGGAPDEYVTFSYPRSRTADGFTMSPQVSTALSGWQPLDSMFTLASQTANGDGTETITWRSIQPASALSGRLFLRVEVTTP